MLIFLADGRLGNQLFQYSFLKSIQLKNEVLVTSGFEELDTYFEHDYYLNLNKQNRYIRFFVYEIIQKIMNLLGNIRLITTLEVVVEQIGGLSRESNKYNTKYGLFQSVKIVKLGYFQSENFINKSQISTLKLKPLYLNNATRFMQTLPRDVYPVFIHVRQGDYKYHTISGKGTNVPMTYYKEGISWFAKNKKNPYFIFLSDEPQFIESDFKDIKNKVISDRHDAGTDMAIMTMCRGAVLSPSSYSWWGSFMMKERDVVIAPRYWLGFNWQTEYQSGGTPSYARVIKIC